MAGRNFSTVSTYNSIGEFSSDSYFARNPYFEQPKITERPKRDNKKVKEKRKNKSITVSMNTGEKGKAILTVILIGIICVMVVLMSAYAAGMKNHNNNLIKENGYLQSEIDSLNIKIGEASKIDYIEKVAIEELGMVYPDCGRCIYVSDEDMPKESLAGIIKKGAYN